MEKVSVKDEEFKIFLDSCMTSLLMSAIKTKVPPAIREEFREGLVELLKENQKDISEDNVVPYMFAVIEDLLRIVSRSIVGMAARNPTILQTYGDLSEGQVDLLRREMEDHLLTISGDTLKSLILEDHINFNPFCKKQEKG
ncbi:hypothetical protein LCGC14_1914110 [marine sediment metagenome]|uniref:Uncharacterized protein n=1 Tax=marine sediment metagenome TaxID=412755 RepID=A0A0F9FTD2_9ZZZZ